MNDDLKFLDDMTRDVVEASRVRPGEMAGSAGPNQLAFTVVRPGGGELYPALWTRDFVLSLKSGYLTDREILDAVGLLAATQAVEDKVLPSGSRVPRGSIADHVNLDGVPIYYPGTYDPAVQGGPWGALPSLDDQFFFVILVRHAARLPGGRSFLGRDVAGMSLLDRTELAFSMPPASPDNGLVCTTDSSWGVSFGFTDTVKHTGELLFASLLRCDAAGQLAELCTEAGLGERSRGYSSLRAKLGATVARVFAHPSGLLRAATGRSGQPDVWGTAYALHRGLLPSEAEPGTRRALARAVDAGTVSWAGQIRHVPTDLDYDAERVWELTVGKHRKGTYQHGAYWATPLGWVLDALAPVDRSLARRLLAEYVEHLRREDYRTRGGDGAPWECVHPSGDYRQNGVYMTSVAAVLPAARRLLE